MDEKDIFKDDSSPMIDLTITNKIGAKAGIICSQGLSDNFPGDLILLVPLEKNSHIFAILSGHEV